MSRVPVLIGLSCLALLALMSAGVWFMQSNMSPRTRQHEDEAAGDVRSAEQSPSAHVGVQHGDSVRAARPAADTRASGASSAVKDLADQRARLDETVWKQEKLAQRYEAFIVRLWDQLLAQSTPDGKSAVLKAVPLGQISVGSISQKRNFAHGIQSWTTSTFVKSLDREKWIDWLAGFHQAGFRLRQSEWHHAAFEVDDQGRGRSTVAVVLHVANPEQKLRAIVEGDLEIQWSSLVRDGQLPMPTRIDATRLRVLTRTGSPGFVREFQVDPSSPGRPGHIHPVLVHDLNGDGRSEIVVAGSNHVYWNDGDWRFRQTNFLPGESTARSVGLLADLNGDQRVDFVTPSSNGNLLLYLGQAGGQFSMPDQPEPKAAGPLARPQAITAGDIDRDGDLDLWIGQYKPAYTHGQMPTPYYDANDGLPAFLLMNDGAGNFQDATEAAGLGRKRLRRSYAGTFVDLDNDHDLDLLVVSDFAGIDVYMNDGRGRFEDRTTELVDEWHNFGMSATFGDYDRDGHADFFVTGMASTTARRLQAMNAGRNEHADVQRFRPIMGYGNRMYVSRSGRYLQPAFRDQVARTGWSWGTTTLDFDNDGFPDLFTANGHSSGKSTKDHCWHFWCHDIYTGSSQLSRPRAQLFRQVLAGYLDRSESWDGYQTNVLLMNVAGHGFVNVAFLMGVADQHDGRAVVADDLDNDGRVDLLVVEDRLNEGQILHVYRNQMQTDHHWIGVRLPSSGWARSPLGARIVVVTPSGNHESHVIAGNSISSQQPMRLHFGLGMEHRVDRIEVYLAGGVLKTMNSPRVDQYITFPPGN